MAATMDHIAKLDCHEGSNVTQEARFTFCIETMGEYWPWIQEINEHILYRSAVLLYLLLHY